MRYLLIALIVLGIVPVIGTLPVALAEGGPSFPQVTDNQTTDVYFFYSSTCPHCKAEMEFLQSIDGTCDHLNIHYILAYENQDLLDEFVLKYNTTKGGVPRTFIEDKVFAGFTHSDGELEYDPVRKAYLGYQNVILEQINYYLNFSNHSMSNNQQCNATDANPTVGIKEASENSWVFLLLLIYGLSYFALKKKLRSNNHAKKYWISGLLLLTLICCFIFITSMSEVSIKDFAESLPFPFFVAVIALADGFNPCAFTVLIILLSLLTYTKSRKDMTILGMTFVLTSAIMYFIFIMIMVLVGSWAFEKYGQVILIVLGIVILIAGLINLKDFFFFKTGPSLSISDKDKLSVTKKARKIVQQLRESKTARTFIIAIGGTILLAIFVNLIELGCTAILPAVYMASLVKSFGHTIAMGHIIWTLFYSIIYVIPLLAILFVFIYSFKSTRITEKQGRFLKLLSGIFMVFFGLIMIIWPELLVFG
ncbi:glutaredoxin family protein [Candidatus Woesearchaeota archaeon]|nr:glutaredoxin family protein [Candidatus Woesearchaeota archaeon]